MANFCNDHILYYRIFPFLRMFPQYQIYLNIKIIITTILWKYTIQSLWTLCDHFMHWRLPRKEKWSKVSFNFKTDWYPSKQRNSVQENFVDSEDSFDSVQELSTWTKVCVKTAFSRLFLLAYKLVLVTKSRRSYVFMRKGDWFHVILPPILFLVSLSRGEKWQSLRHYICGFSLSQRYLTLKSLFFLLSWK